MKPSDEQAPFAAATGSAVDATARRNTERAESVIRKVVARTGLAYQDENLLRRLLIDAFADAERAIAEAQEVVGWAQAMLTALNVGHVQSGSPLHHKLREVMIAYRVATEPLNAEVSHTAGRNQKVKE